MANTNAISPIMWQQAAHTTCQLSSHIILCLHGWNKLLAATTYPTYKITRLQIGRQTKCITALTHHPLANSQNVSPYLHTTNSWTGRQTKSITVVTYHWCVNSQIDKMYHHTHTPPTYEQADRQTKCITTPTLPTHEQADRQTKCITTLSHHPFTVGHTKCITISWTGRQTDKMYYHTRTSPSHKQTLRQTDWWTKCITVLTHRPLANSQTDRQNMYHCTHTSPTCEQSDRQTKYVSLYSHIAHLRTVRQRDKICITVLTRAQRQSERPQWWSSSWSSWLHACWPLCRCQLQEEWTHQEPPRSGQSSPSADHADQTHRLHTARTGVYKLRELSRILRHLQGREQQTHELYTLWHARKMKTKSFNNNNDHF